MTFWLGLIKILTCTQHDMTAASGQKSSLGKICLKSAGGNCIRNLVGGGGGENKTVQIWHCFTPLC